MAAHMKYNAKYHDAWAWSLAMKGATDEEIAEAFGVSRQTIIRWSRVKNEKGETVLTSFGEALQQGKYAADAQVEKKLYERCMGYDVEEEEKVIDVNKDGSSKIGRITSRKKHVAPDTMAIMYWLNNRKRSTGEWSQRQDINLSGSLDTGPDLSRLTDDELRAIIRSASEESE